MPMRALGLNGGSNYDVLQAARYAAGLDNSSGRLPAQRALVVNLSFAGVVKTQSEQEACAAARVADHGLRRAGAIGHAGGVSQVDDGLVGHRLEHLVLGSALGHPVRADGTTGVVLGVRGMLPVEDDVAAETG